MVYSVVFLVLLPCFVLVHFSGCFPLVLYFLPFLTTPVLCSPNCPAPLQVSTHRSGPVPHVSPQPPLMFSIWCVFGFCSLLGSCLCFGLVCFMNLMFDWTVLFFVYCPIYFCSCWSCFSLLGFQVFWVHFLVCYFRLNCLYCHSIPSLCSIHSPYRGLTPTLTADRLIYWTGWEVCECLVPKYDSKKGIYVEFENVNKVY